MTAARLPCLVPGCRRTCRREEFSEWICGRHWVAISVRLRRLRAARKRAHQKAEAIFMRQYARQGSCFRDDQVRAVAKAREADDRAWSMCKRQAIERAMGIG